MRVQPMVRQSQDGTDLCDALAGGAASLFVIAACGGQQPGSGRPDAVSSGLVRVSRVPFLMVRTPPEPPYRRVLFAVDGTWTSLAAALAGARLTPDSEHFIVHAYVVPGEHLLVMRGMDAGGTAELRRAAAAQVRPSVERMAAALRPRPPRVVVTAGCPRTALPDMAQRYGADLVVVGTGGRSRLGCALLGSVAQDVMARAPCDVLAVPVVRHDRAPKAQALAPGHPHSRPSPS
ncbi:universal stress protein [Streptomyces sp. NPDC048389]|uniref:universal stress protein n=1 Tax=Streptomyces sp. NPDC048389 TaxID=3154622 RepID=UPI003451A57C